MDKTINIAIVIILKSLLSLLHLNWFILQPLASDMFLSSSSFMSRADTFLYSEEIKHKIW